MTTKSREYLNDFLLLAAVSAIFFLIHAAAWPLVPGADFKTYLDYYVDYITPGDTFKWLLLHRTPLSPFFLGGLYHLGGGLLLEIAKGILYILAILSHYFIALQFNRKVALLSVSILLLYPDYALYFHKLGSESLFIPVFLLWSAFIIHTAINPYYRNFALSGVFLFLLVMIRPSSMLFLVFAIFPFLFTQYSLKQKLYRSVLFLMIGGSLLLSFAIYNFVRFDHFVVTRAGHSHIPFWRVFCINRTVFKENGPASNALYDAVKGDLVLREPYKSLNMSADDIFSTPKNIKNTRVWSDLVVLCDRTWGPDTNYEMLGKVGWEAVWKYPGPFIKQYIIDLIQMFYGRRGSRKLNSYPEVITEYASDSKTAHGVKIFSEGQITPYSSLSRRYSLNDENKVERENANSQFQKLKQQMGLDLELKPLSTRNPVPDLSTALNFIGYLVPPVISMLAASMIFLLLLRNKIFSDIRIKALLFLCGMALFSIMVSINAGCPLRFRIPFDPLFITMFSLVFIRDWLKEHNTNHCPVSEN